MQIISVSKKDAFYPERKELIGKTGTFYPLAKSAVKNYFSGMFVFAEPHLYHGFVSLAHIHFYAVRIRK